MDAGAAVNDTIGVGITSTVCVAAALVPPVPVQVSEYVVPVVKAAVTCVPLAANVPLHPPDAVHAVAFAELHVKVEVAPFATDRGLALNWTLGIAVTMTATVVDTTALVPPGPLHVTMNSVVPVTGPLLFVPLTASVPLQPPLAVQEVALVELQVRVAMSPPVMLLVEAESDAEGTVGGGVVTAVSLEPPPQALSRSA